MNFFIQPVGEERLNDLYQLYRQCEDFLALGPVAQASEDMVLADLALSREHGGAFCGIYDPASGALMGVLETIPARGAEAAPYISLLMIGAPYRRRGLGKAVLAALEDDLRRQALEAGRGPLRSIEASVQVNNPEALRFWQREGFGIISAPALQPDGTTSVDMRKELV